MTENNTPTQPAIILGVTAEDLSAHRAGMVEEKDSEYRLYLNTSHPADQPHAERVRQLQNLIEIWDNMSDAERAEVIADERTRTEAPAEPAEPALPELLEAIAGKPYTDSADRPVILSAVTKLIELELGNEQKAEAMSNAEATIRQQGDQIRTLSSAQISGDDFRLREFWQTAGELAESAGYCEQYDHLAEQLGGPARRKEFTVHHAITVSVTVSAYTSQTASADPDSDEFSEWSDYNSASDLEEEIREAIKCGNFTIEEEEIQDWEEN